VISGETAQPIIEIFDDLVPSEAFLAACRSCAVARWYFGHESHKDDPIPFWSLELAEDPAFDDVWKQVRARCEALAGRALCVIRQYATGHTYGLGGKPHNDDRRAGCFTLLYYPMPEWKAEWEGETVFYDSDNEIVRAISPRPNRAVFFDSRIVHAGHAPSRACPALRIAVAFKLEPVPLSEMPSAVSAQEPSSAALPVEEISQEGAERVYAVRIPGERIAALVRERLLETGKGLRLPGFRPGKIPLEVLEQRYGSRAREAVRNTLAVEAAQQLLAGGSLTSATQASDSAGSGDLLLRLTATHLPSLPEPPFHSVSLTRLTAASKEASALLEASFRRQVLDQLDAAYQFTIAPVLIEKELYSIRVAAQAQLRLLDEADRRAAEAEMRLIAERRVRLGAVVLEIARRLGIAVTDAQAQSARGPGESLTQARGRLTEDRVISSLVHRASVTERPATQDELDSLSAEGA
jgi:hypothetical protein